MAEDLAALARETIASSRASRDPDYPLIHLAPPIGRLNDPNGLLVDGDAYHVFYQFGPFHPGRKLVYWGHASSPDLLTWSQHGPAIVPDSAYDRSGAYSGGALVLDDDEAARAPAGARFQLFYTGNLKDPVTGVRTSTQALVTSPDLARFTKWPGNPIIERPDGYTAHFRDPQVWRDPDAPGAYRMIVGAQRLDATGAALLYRSTDLAAWRFEGELRFPDAHGALDSLGYMWECPGIVRLPDETTGGERDVLIFCPQGIRPQEEGYENVFPCVYAVSPASTRSGAWWATSCGTATARSERSIGASSSTRRRSSQGTPRGRGRRSSWGGPATPTGTTSPASTPGAGSTP